MSAELPAWEKQLNNARERLEQASAEKHIAAIEDLSSTLAERIKKRTITPGDIDAFLSGFPAVPAELKEFLLSKKADLLRYEQHEEEALKYYDEALLVMETPATLIAKGDLLLHMNHIDEAFQAFRKAYDLKEDFGSRKQEFLWHLFSEWGFGAHQLGFESSLKQDFRKFEKGVHEFLDVMEKAKSEGMESEFNDFVGRLASSQEGMPKEFQDAEEEFMLAVKLLSIKDPFEGWRALAKEISKVWPKDVSAVDAIREQRYRGWNLSS